MKTCTRCSIEQPLSNFTKDKRRPDGLYDACKTCKNSKARQLYKNDTSYQNSVKKRCSERGLVVSNIINAAKSVGCKCCSEKEPVALAFHHLDPLQKDRPVGMMRNYSVEKVLAEIEKCIVVCHNCHAKIHDGIIQTD